MKKSEFKNILKEALREVIIEELGDIKELIKENKKPKLIKENTNPPIPLTLDNLSKIVDKGPPALPSDGPELRKNEVTINEIVNLMK